MAALSIQVPYPVFYDRDGQPLDNGNIYIGVANLDPVTNPLQVYYNEALTITASQPLKTSNGYVYRNGTPAQLYVNATDFSITVNDSKNLFVYSFPEGTGISPNASGVAFTGFKGQVGTVADIADADGSDWIGYTPAGGSAVARSGQDKMRDTVNVKDFGAVGDGIADDTSEIQAAINYIHGLPSGGQVWFNGTFAISDTLTIGKNVHLCGVATIKQNTNNKPIIKVNKDLFNSRWSISGLTFEYTTQQTAANTDGRAIVLCEANKFSYLFTVENISITKAFKGIDAPEETDSFAFLGTFNNVNINQCTDWGFDWRNATSGASTFLSMNNVWVNNTDGSEIATSKGFRIKRCDSLCINSLAIDHIQTNPFQLETCTGNIGNVSIEQCDRTTGSGGVHLCEVSGGAVNFGEINVTSNNTTISGSAFASAVRVSDAGWVEVGILKDNLNTVVDTSSDAFYTVSITSNSTLYVKEYVYAAAGSNPVPNASLADFSQVPRVRLFDNNVRTDTRGGKVHIFGTAAPVSGTWAVGDIVWNTTPVAGGFIGWTCTTAGTPGTWKTFGAVTA